MECFIQVFFNGVIILWCLILLMSYFYIINLINLKLYTRINCLSYSCSRAPDLLKAVQQVWGWAEFGVDFDFHHTLWSICILSHLWCRCSVQIIFQLLPLGVAPSHPTPRLAFIITSLNLLCGLPRFLLSGSSGFSILCPIYSTISPLCMSRPSQTCFSNFVSFMLDLSHPSDILISSPVHPGYYQQKS